MNQPQKISGHVEAESYHGDILIVDDSPANLQLLTGMLRDCGYKVRPVTSGKMALQAARLEPPDLVLLDINMPEMSGYEVCRQFKADEKLESIPVIFISALNEVIDKVKAFGEGGADYITKPFQFEEVEARIKTHLELRKLHLELEAQNDILEEKVRLRTVELTQARNRLSILDSAKSDFLELISHELRTPLNGVLGISELLFDLIPAEQADRQLITFYDQSKQRLLSTLDDALLLTQIGHQAATLTVTPVSLTSALYQAVAKVMSSPFYEPQTTFGTLPLFLVPIMADEAMLSKALQGILEIAMKFSTPGMQVEFSDRSSSDNIILEVRSTGAVIPENLLAKIFDVMIVPETVVPGGELGLKLPLCQRIIALLDGEMSIENTHPSGIIIKAAFRRYPVSENGVTQEINISKDRPEPTA